MVYSNSQKAHRYLLEAVSRSSPGKRSIRRFVPKNRAVPFLAVRSSSRKYCLPPGSKPKPNQNPNLGEISQAEALNAECVIAGLKGLKGNPLSAFFSAKAAAITAYTEKAPR